MVQISINMGMTKAVIFISGNALSAVTSVILILCYAAIHNFISCFLSGNAHFGDILAKRLPKHDKWGESQTLYEVVSSGIGQRYVLRTITTTCYVGSYEITTTIFL